MRAYNTSQEHEKPMGDVNSRVAALRKKIQEKRKENEVLWRRIHIKSVD